MIQDQEPGLVVGISVQVEAEAEDCHKFENNLVYIVRHIPLIITTSPKETTTKSYASYLSKLFV